MNPTLTRTWSAILFDLDGTITDSAPAITSALARTFALLDRPVPTAAALHAYVGPPMITAFQDYAGMTRDESVAATAVFRSEYSGAAALDTAVFPGMIGLIERLFAAGIPLALATSKPETTARDILDHFHLTQYFTAIVGASADDTRSTKADIVGEALARLAGAGADMTAPVLVGDRVHDARGAAAHNVPAILVEWGYGSPAEAVDATAVVHSTDRLGKLLLG